MKRKRGLKEELERRKKREGKGDHWGQMGAKREPIGEKELGQKINKNKNWLGRWFSG